MDTVSLTYEEIADRLNISLPSARQKVRRNRWMKTKGNDGKVRVSVPREDLETISIKADISDTPKIENSDIKIAELSAKIHGLERVIEAEKRAHDAQASRANAQELRAEAAERERDLWKEKATKPWWKILK